MVSAFFEVGFALVLVAVLAFVLNDRYSAGRGETQSGDDVCHAVHPPGNLRL